jgi:hypothetical protein
MATSIETSVAEAAWDAVMRLVLRAADLDDIKPLNDKDAELIRDLKQAVGDVFADTNALINELRRQEV